jgi:hypothetical protein
MNKITIGFTLISGIGWILDFFLMSTLVKLGIEPGVANFISASMAGTLVYWSSRRWLFKKQFGLAATGGFIFYLVYTSLAVLFFSALIQFSSITIFDYLNSNSYHYSLVVAAIFSKILFTPFNLLMNYIVSCKLSKRF